jgi:hypothetical protein
VFSLIFELSCKEKPLLAVEQRLKLGTDGVYAFPSPQPNNLKKASKQKLFQKESP